MTVQSIPNRAEFIDEFVMELTRCARTYITVHRDDSTNWTAAELGSLAHDVMIQMIEAA